MPSAINSEPEVAQISSFAALLNEALQHARDAKPTTSIEPPLAESNFGSFLTALPSVFANSNTDAPTTDKTRQFAIVETAARDLFDTLVVSPRPMYNQIMSLPAPPCANCLAINRQQHK